MTERLSAKYSLARPTRRPLKIFASDPMAGHTAGNRITIDVPNEELSVGPVGERLEVIDYDGAQRCFYPPVDLNDPAILMQGGLDPAESDPRFHQQMVYAVAMRTLENFGRALGRLVMFGTRKYRRLRLFPHAFYGANAFYDRSVNGILFGYFRADKDNPGPNLPGQNVFTCLSHDIIVHEMTHALVDRLRRYFLEASNEDVLAFHEGFVGNPKRRFLPGPGTTNLLLETDALPGVSVYVLGPSRDKEVIRDMNPPAGESYLRLAGSLGAGAAVPAPFAPEWRITPATWAEIAAGQDTGGLRRVLLRSASQNASGAVLPSLSPEDQEAITKLGDLEQAVAVSLDKAVNGTSLVLVLKIGHVHLLFPGDAQWGSWQAALRNPVANELLRKTTFFKVSHHGSHNGTPREFVEEIMLAQGVWSMVSTGHVAQWPEIPKAELLDALTGHGCIFARSDKAAEADSTIFHTSGDVCIDVHIPVSGLAPHP